MNGLLDYSGKPFIFAKTLNIKNRKVMKKYAILTVNAFSMSYGTAPKDDCTARLDEGKFNSSNVNSDKTAKDLIRNEDGSIRKFISQVDALNYCISLGWNLEQTIFEPHDGMNARDPLSSFIFILYKELEQ